MSSFEEDTDISEYEMQRLLNIEENKKQMILILGKAKEDILTVSKAKVKQVKKKKPRTVYPLRRSERISGSLPRLSLCGPWFRGLHQEADLFMTNGETSNLNGRYSIYEDGEWDTNGGWKGWDDRYVRLEHLSNLWSIRRRVRTESPKRRSSPSVRSVRAISDITPEDLNTVAMHTSEKVHSFGDSRGTSCHQCRQKTLDMKTICRLATCIGVRGQFCGVCLNNRYGESAREALMDPIWFCPPCRNICNCSICRTKIGLAPTGVLYPKIKAEGYDSVHESLQKKDE